MCIYIYIYLEALRAVPPPCCEQARCSRQPGETVREGVRAGIDAASLWPLPLWPLARIAPCPYEPLPLWPHALMARCPYGPLLL